VSRDTYIRAIATLTLALTIIVLWTPQLRSQCAYNDLSLEKAEIISTSPEYLRFDQSAGRWMAIGIVSAAADNWDVGVYEHTAGFPNCVQAPPLKISDNTSGIDFVVGDFTENRAGTYYALALQTSGRADAGLEWSSQSVLLTENDWPIQGTLRPDNLLDCYTVRLEAAKNYVVTFKSAKGSGTRVYLFHNGASAPYWANKNEAAVEDSATFNYTAPATDWYSIVVTNENGSTGSYTLGLGTCKDALKLLAGNPLYTYGYENHYEIEQASTGWAAVGFRRPVGNPEVSIYGTAFGNDYPVCMDSWISTSTTPQWETALVAAPTGADGIPHNSYWLRAPQPEEGGLGRIEWDNAFTQVVPNHTVIQRVMNTPDVLEVMITNLQAGVEYTFNFDRYGEIDANLLLFRNDGSPTWYERANAVFTTSEPAQYTPPDAGWYGIVVVNDNAQNGSYTLEINTCALPVELQEGVAEVTPPGIPTTYYRFVQQVPVWVGVGVRSVDDWDMHMFDYGTGGSPPLACRDWLLASSILTGSEVDFVMGDFNRNPRGDYYPEVTVKTGSSQASVLWAYNPDPLIPNTGPREVIITESEFLHVFDVFLVGGEEYNIDFYRSIGSAEARFLLYQASGDTYWTARGSRILEGTSATLFTPSETGTYGLAAVSESDGSGTFYFDITAPTVAVEGAMAPGQAGIQALIPNPTRGALTIQFALSKAGPASFEIVDVAGRVVASIPGQNWEKGQATTEWNGFTSRGMRAAPGVYFVRMKQAGETFGVKRMVLLD
jgi:hypothetical protein